MFTFICFVSHNVPTLGIGVLISLAAVSCVLVHLVNEKYKIYLEGVCVCARVCVVDTTNLYLKLSWKQEITGLRMLV